MIGFFDVLKAADLLKDEVIRTPLVYSPTFSRMASAEVYLKLENLQMGGSFKVRGATYKLLSHPTEIQTGVVAAQWETMLRGWPWPPVLLVSRPRSSCPSGPRSPSRRPHALMGQR